MRIFIPSFGFTAIITVIWSIFNRTRIIEKPIEFWQRFADDMEIILAYYDFLPAKKGGVVAYYECRRAFVPPILIIRRGGMVQINGPWGMIKVMARDIPALLEPKAAQASP
jgi:hypothetical protein